MKPNFNPNLPPFSLNKDPNNPDQTNNTDLNRGIQSAPLFGTNAPNFGQQQQGFMQQGNAFQGQQQNPLQPPSQFNVQPQQGQSQMGQQFGQNQSFNASNQSISPFVQNTTSQPFNAQFTQNQPPPNQFAQQFGQQPQNTMPQFQGTQTMPGQSFNQPMQGTNTLNQGLLTQQPTFTPNQPLANASQGFGQSYVNQPQFGMPQTNVNSSFPGSSSLDHSVKPIQSTLTSTMTQPGTSNLFNTPNQGSTQQSLATTQYNQVPEQPGFMSNQPVNQSFETKPGASFTEKVSISENLKQEIPLNFINKTASEIIHDLKKKLENNAKTFTKKASLVYSVDEMIIQARNNYLTVLKALEEEEQKLGELEENIEFFTKLVSDGKTHKNALSEVEELCDEYSKWVEEQKEGDEEVEALVGENMELIKWIKEEMDEMERTL